MDGRQPEMKLLIDLSTFEKVHKGGKDEVAYNLLRGFSKLGYVQRIVCVARQELISNIHEIDPEYTVIPLERKHYRGRIGNIFAPVTDALYGLRLRKVVKKNGCDRVLFTNKLSPFVRQKVKTYLIPHDIQFLHRLDGNRKLKIYTRIIALYIRLSFRFCDNIIAISEFDKNEMIRFMPWSEKKIVRIYDPVRFKTVKPEKERTSITSLNIQHDHKNTITLIKAFVRIAPDIKEKLVLVGRKNFQPAIEKEINMLISESHLSDRIIFTGFVNEEKLTSIISHTRIFVNPSLFEGFGMAAVEMMESEVPTIVADNTAQAEVTMGLCRYYKPATDEIALSKEILEELYHPTEKQQLKMISESIRERYHYQRIAEEYWNTIMNEATL